jgi:hypothetical protein
VRASHVSEDKAKQGGASRTWPRWELAAAAAAHLKGPEERCEGTNVHGVTCDGQEMVHDAGDLREQHADVLPGQDRP